MRLHISLDDATVAAIDRRVPRRGRSQYIEAAVQATIQNEARWDSLRSAFGSIPAEGHDWDQDPAGWVREQRSDTSRSG